MYVDPNGHWWDWFWNSVGDWFKNHFLEIIVGTAFIIGGAIITALTAGAGVRFASAFGSAMFSSVVQVGLSTAVGIGANGISNIINGKDFFHNVGGVVASSYMWGGIFSGGAQILGGGFRIAANKGVLTGRKGGIKFGNSKLKILSPDKNNWTKVGGTLIKFGSVLRVDTGAMWGLHMHLLGSGHLPIGSIIAGLIGIEN